MGGQAEKKVRDSLQGRPAGIRARLSQEALLTFDGLFCGALSKGSFTLAGELFIGKAECERYWPEAYEELRDAGLIIFTTYEKDNHPEIGGKTRYLEWEPTELGREVRCDDLAWFNELMEAYDEDKKA